MKDMNQRDSVIKNKALKEKTQEEDDALRQKAVTYIKFEELKDFT